ncbi:MAG: hypothetical protein ABR540_13930 [Acidimicrobiales bacterium]|nr:hypothetical protein [Actinomycetota bacterium]
MAESVGSRVVLKARELRTSGRAALGDLPSVEELTALPEDDRRRVREGLRVELYAISSLVAEATVERARQRRADHPPFGLVRSGHTDYRMLMDSPETVTEGTIGGFYALGKAYVDTMVLHLDGQMKDWIASGEGWKLDRLDRLVELFRVGAGPMTRPRLRDRFSFIYGGLHFGTGVCVQLAEVMVRMLGAYPDLTADERVEVLLRSARPANRLAAFNVDHVVIAYQDLLGPAPIPSSLSAPATPLRGPLGPQAMRWFSPDKFAVEDVEGQPWRIDFSNEETLGGRPRGGKLLDVPTTYATQGCPARISPTGGVSPIAGLWDWCVHLVRDLGLI